MTFGFGNGLALIRQQASWTNFGIYVYTIGHQQRVTHWVNENAQNVLAHFSIRISMNFICIMWLFLPFMFELLLLNCDTMHRLVSRCLKCFANFPFSRFQGLVCYGRDIQRGEEGIHLSLSHTSINHSWKKKYATQSWNLVQDGW